LVPTPACFKQASRRVTNVIPLGCALFLPVDTINCVETREGMVPAAPPTIVKVPAALKNVHRVRAQHGRMTRFPGRMVPHNGAHDHQSIVG
jgi:hypothetical protein